jgi:hypothetical protein
MAALAKETEIMSGTIGEGSAALTTHGIAHHFSGDSSTAAFDWVDYACCCPHCGAEVTTFRTKDLCNQRDRVDYRIAQHFYGECRCGAWLDFIRKPASGIEDFDMYVETS